ncbi:MAG: DMT family transporter [Maricaulaceae bacterium]
MTEAALPISLMLMSAALHAVVGVLMKGSQDKTLFRAMFAFISGVILIPFLFILPLPPASAWGYLIIGALIHFAYQLAQIKAFETGDMSVVYPVMRGSAPALAALFALILLAETLGPVAIAGLIIAVSALIMFGFSGLNFSGGVKLPQKTALGFALFCGVMTALYTVIDGAGMRITRQSGTLIFSYIAWFFVLDGISLPIVAVIKERRNLWTAMRPDMVRSIWAGLLSFVSYSAALYALSVAPIGKMAALRETSVVFGAILAALILKEPFGKRRIILAAILAFGLVMMQVG